MSSLKIPTSALQFFEKMYKKTTILSRLLSKPTLANAVYKYVMKPLAFNETTNLNAGFRASFINTGGGLLPKEDLEVFLILAQESALHFQKVIDAIKNDKPILGCLWSNTRLFFKGFDVVDLTLEAMPRYAYSYDYRLGVKYFDVADDEKFLYDGCSFQRAAYGAMQLGHLPSFAAYVAYTHPCDTINTTYQNLEYMAEDTPLFSISSPYDRSEKSLKYVAEQLRELILSLEKILNQKYNWDKVKELAEEYNKFSYYAYELTLMMRNIPSPISALEMDTLWAGRSNFSGLSELTRAAEILYNNAKERIFKNKGIMKNEKIRIAWWEPPVDFVKLYPWLQEKYGASVISNYVSNMVHHQIDTSSEQKCLEGLAELDLLHGMSRQAHGKTEFATSELQTIIDEYSPDCVIFTGHQGCKHGHAHARILLDLCKKNNLPALAMNIDLLDPRVSSEEEIKKELDEFFRMNGWG